MDEHTGNSNKIVIDSLHDDTSKVIQVKVADLNKKRKLENEQLFFPLSKHKFGYRSSSSKHEQPLAEKLEENEVIQAHPNKGKRVVELAEESSELQSSKDSNSFVGGSDFAMCGNAENENTLEAEYPPQACTHTQSFTSSATSTCSSNSLKDTLHSLHSRIVKETTVGLVAVVGEPNHPNFKDQLQLGPGARFSVDQIQDFEEHADPICLAYQVDSLEQCLEEDLEDEMLYSNGPLETDEFVLSSGRWSIEKEARQKRRPPTIDQEFVEYFSALMLL